MVSVRQVLWCVSTVFVASHATDIFNDNWRQAEAYIMLFIGAVEVNALVHGALRRVTQWPWIELQPSEADLLPLS